MTLRGSSRILYFVTFLRLKQVIQYLFGRFASLPVKTETVSLQHFLLLDWVFHLASFMLKACDTQRSMYGDILGLVMIEQWIIKRCFSLQ